MRYRFGMIRLLALSLVALLLGAAPPIPDSTQAPADPASEVNPLIGTANGATPSQAPFYLSGCLHGVPRTPEAT